MDKTKLIFASIVGIAILIVVAVSFCSCGITFIQDIATESAATAHARSLFTPTATATFTPTPTHTPTSTPTPTPTPTPGAEFMEDCDQNPSAQWDTSFGGGGTWLTVNDKCTFLPSSKEELNLALVGFPYWRDYALDVDVHYTRDDKDDYCGVVVLAQDARNYFYFSMGSRFQRVEWWMRIDDELKLVPETQQRSALKDDTVYHLRIEVSSGGIVTYLDSVEICRFGSQMFDNGLVGLLVYSDGAFPQRLCAFDDFQVSPLEP